VAQCCFIECNFTRCKTKYITELFFKLPVMSLAFKKIFNELQNV
jgi:hypothetical protein